MRLRDNVRVTGRKHLTLHGANVELKVREKDCYILRAVAGGVCDDAKLIALVSADEGVDEVTAELRLAQIVLDYGEFLAPAEQKAIEV